MNIRQKLRGTGVAITTPFLENGEIDFFSLERQTEHVIKNGVNYIVLFGTTGEAVTISEQEKVETSKRMKQIIAGRVPLVAGFGGNNTSELVSDLKNFDFDGIDAILSVCPYYNKPNQEGIYQHFKAVTQAVDLPFIIYNVPGRTVVSIDTSTTLRIAKDCKNVVGIKAATDNLDLVMELINNKPDDFLVIAGDDSLALPFIALGADGVISVIANAFPYEFSNLINFSLKGDFFKAREFHYKLIPLMQTLLKAGNPAGIKAVMNVLDLCQYHFRLPVHGVDDVLFELIKSETLKINK